jgi:hypothetical protein
MSMLTLYFLIKLDAILFIMGITAFVCFVWGFLIWVKSCISIDSIKSNINKRGREVKNEGEEKIREIKKKSRKLISRFVTIGIIFFIVAAMIPNTKQVAFLYIVNKMDKAGKVDKIGDQMIELPDKALQVLNLKLDEYINDMKPKENTNERNR